MIKASLRLLRALTLFAATVALVAQAIAVTSNAWLYSIELMPNPRYNGTGDKEHLEKRTVSGLWRLCYNNPGRIIMKCENIDYFPKEEYSPDPNDSTMAIPYAVKRAAAFIFMSCIILMFGFLLCILGSVCPKRPVISFSSGIAYILSGLLVLTGMVIYISTFKSEVGNKLRPRSSFQGPMFRYHYGYSFILAVCALMMSELAGTFTIFLFINWHKTDIKKRQSLRHHHHQQHHHPHHHKYAEFSPTSMGEDHIGACRRHRGGGGGGRRNSKARDSSEDISPCPSTSRGMRRTVHTSIPMSESMRDLAYYNLPPFSRDTTCNTVSTSADINREYSREFSFEILRRTTPV